LSGTWPPEPGHAEFVGERRLSDEQIRLIQQWIEQGAAEGFGSTIPPAPKFADGWQLGPPDLVLKAAEAYTLPAGGSDVFRNFVIPVPVSSSRYVRAVEILPGNKKIVHHANILIDRTGVSRYRDEQDPEVGFGGMDLTMESETFEPDSHFLFWKPGTPPHTEPDDMAWRVDKATDLVLNMHLQPSGKAESIQPSVGLYFTDKPPSRFPMLLQLERDGALDIPAGEKDFVVTDEVRLPVDVDVLAVYPHAHYLGSPYFIPQWKGLPNRYFPWEPGAGERREQPSPGRILPREHWLCCLHTDYYRQYLRHKGAGGKAQCKSGRHHPDPGRNAFFQYAGILQAA